MKFNAEVKSIKLNPSQVCELTMTVEDAPQGTESTKETI